MESPKDEAGGNPSGTITDNNNNVGILDGAIKETNNDNNALPKTGNSMIWGAGLMFIVAGLLLLRKKYNNNK